MAKRTIHMLIDDISGEEADESIRFVVDGVEYEIDLSKKNADKMREVFATYTQSGTKLGRIGRVPQQRAVTYRRTELAATGDTRKEQNRAIREWAAQQNIRVSDRGRIRTEVEDAYEGRETPQAGELIERARHACGVVTL